MTKTELRERIVNGESSILAFSSDAVTDHQLATDMAALANLQGGCVVLGVDEDGRVRGLVEEDPPADVADRGVEVRTYRRLEERVMRVCREKIRPQLVPWFEVLPDVEPGLDVAVVGVERGWSVHHVWLEQQEACFIRAGSVSREASASVVASLRQQRGADRTERHPVSGTTITDLDHRRLEDYFVQVRQQDTPSAAPSDEWGSLLVNTQLLDDSDRRPATVAGLLLFGRDPSRYLPHAEIAAAVYRGRETRYDARERRTLRGPIVRLNTTDGGVLEPGLAEQALEFVQQQARRDYPEEAVREAIVNAIVHRDYVLSGAQIELSIYRNRLEVVSPGGLADRITPARMRIGCRSARNQLLKDVMRDYGYLERMGMGIPRTIMRSMQAHNGTEPELIEADETFTLRLWKTRSE